MYNDKDFCVIQHTTTTGSTLVFDINQHACSYTPCIQINNNRKYAICFISVHLIIFNMIFLLISFVSVSYSPPLSECKEILRDLLHEAVTKAKESNPTINDTQHKYQIWARLTNTCDELCRSNQFIDRDFLEEQLKQAIIQPQQGALQQVHPMRYSISLGVARLLTSIAPMLSVKIAQIRPELDNLQILSKRILAQRASLLLTKSPWLSIIELKEELTAFLQSVTYDELYKETINCIDLPRDPLFYRKSKAKRDQAKKLALKNAKQEELRDLENTADEELEQDIVNLKKEDETCCYAAPSQQQRQNLEVKVAELSQKNEQLEVKVAELSQKNEQLEVKVAELSQKNEQLEVKVATPNRHVTKAALREIILSMEHTYAANIERIRPNKADNLTLAAQILSQRIYTILCKTPGITKNELLVILAELSQSTTDEQLTDEISNVNQEHLRRYMNMSQRQKESAKAYKERQDARAYKDHAKTVDEQLIEDTKDLDKKYNKRSDKQNASSSSTVIPKPDVKSELSQSITEERQQTEMPNPINFQAYNQSFRTFQTKSSKHNVKNAKQEELRDLENTAYEELEQGIVDLKKEDETCCYATPSQQPRQNLEAKVAELSQKNEQLEVKVAELSQQVAQVNCYAQQILSCLPTFTPAYYSHPTFNQRPQVLPAPYIEHTPAPQTYHNTSTAGGQSREYRTFNRIPQSYLTMWVPVSTTEPLHQ